MMILVALLALGVAFVLWVRWTESRSIYFPIRALETTPTGRGWAFEDVRLTASDGARIHGWFIPAPEDSAHHRAGVTVLMLHGNAGNISHRMEKLDILRRLGADVLIIDYRGYGESQGRPDEAGTYRDAEAAYRHLVSRGIDARTIVLLGESLGSAVASFLAAEHEVGGLVLEEAFTSVPDVAQEMFPFLPVRGLVRNRYDTLGRIDRVAAPVLILHSRGDEFFPFQHGERIAAAARDAVIVELQGSHVDAFIESSLVYREALGAFFAKVLARAADGTGGATR